MSVLYTDRYIKTGYRPPQTVLNALKHRFPTVRLEWHPFLKLWTLWEKQGKRMSYIMALADEKGEYVNPNLHNTIGALRLLQTPPDCAYDQRKWLEGLDKDPAWVAAMEKRGEDRIDRGSREMARLSRGRILVPVPRGGKLRRRK